MPSLILKSTKVLLPPVLPIRKVIKAAESKKLQHPQVASSG